MSAPPPGILAAAIRNGDDMGGAARQQTLQRPQYPHETACKCWQRPLEKQFMGIVDHRPPPDSRHSDDQQSLEIMRVIDSGIYLPQLSRRSHKTLDCADELPCLAFDTPPAQA
jgi:hypothetical protein